MISHQDKIKNNEQLKFLEDLEYKYLKRYFYFLKFSEDDIISGLNTKNKIKKHWLDKWNKTGNDHKISDFNTGAERVIYSLINSKGVGTPNSCPVGSDLMFEVEDAFIHIDLKTVQSSNIGDFTNSIFVGNNQISYNSNYEVNKFNRNFNGANLPHIYEVNDKKKYCLTYFLSILHDKDSFETLCIYITCFPNGLLQPIYGGSVFSAGKNPDKVRFNITECKEFKLLKNVSRLFVVYFNNNMKSEYLSKLSFIKSRLDNQYKSGFTIL